MKITSPIERFHRHVMPEPLSGCWLWTASEDLKGYGQFWVTSNKIIKAYRFAYEHYRGPVPLGLELDHLCRVKICVNPDHLEPVSHRENVLRGQSPTAYHARKTHCKRGHPFDDVNTYTGQGGRVCRECARDSHRKYYKRANARLNIQHRQYRREHPEEMRVKDAANYVRRRAREIGVSRES